MLLWHARGNAESGAKLEAPGSLERLGRDHQVEAEAAREPRRLDDGRGTGAVSGADGRDVERRN
jgi:hypothetical protein